MYTVRDSWERILRCYGRFPCVHWLIEYGLRLLCLSLLQHFPQCIRMILPQNVSTWSRDHSSSSWWKVDVWRKPLALCTSIEIIDNARHFLPIALWPRYVHIIFWLDLGPDSPVVRASRCGRENVGSIPAWGTQRRRRRSSPTAHIFVFDGPKSLNAPHHSHRFIFGGTGHDFRHRNYHCRVHSRSFHLCPTFTNAPLVVEVSCTTADLLFRQLQLQVIHINSQLYSHTDHSLVLSLSAFKRRRLSFI